jgi:soluble lytic murein transglycosylase-like protein
MKKIMLLLIILVSTFFINGSFSSADNNPEINTTIEKFKRQIFLEKMVKEIETESEVKIPNYVDMKYIEYMYLLSKELEVPIRTTFRVVFRESSFIDTVTSGEGAHGFMQVMPDTRKLFTKRYGLDTTKLDNNQKNIFIGMHMLKDYYEYWVNKGNSKKYSWKLTLACYNAGIVAVKLYNGIPPYHETLDYISYVLQPPMKNTYNKNNFLATK